LINLLKRDDIKIEKVHYFYTSLFVARLIFMLKKKFAGNEDKWKYPEKNILTVIIKKILNADFFLNKILSRIFIYLPGLSLLAICKKIQPR